jgi:phosphoribosylanthranilate isomerase
MRTRIKICCIQNEDELHAAARTGADVVGLVSHMPSGPGVIDDETIVRLVDAAPETVRTCLLTSLQDPEEIALQVGAAGADLVQLCDAVNPGALAMLRQQIPATKLMQVVHVRDRTSIDEAIRLCTYVDALLLDSGRPDVERRKLGGTGRTHDWEVSREIVEAVPVPVFLAGGLTPENVADAIAAVGPYGVDVCTGIRDGLALNYDRLDAFARAVRQADGGAPDGDEGPDPLGLDASTPGRQLTARCLECGYQLAGLQSNRCPECGRTFDPDDPATFRPGFRTLVELCKGLDHARAEALASVLQSEGIQVAVIASPHGFSATTYAALWVPADQAAGAERVLGAVGSPPDEPVHEAWDCPECGEHHEGQFSSCWQCGAPRPDSSG